jgi:hypothetical protein
MAEADPNIVARAERSARVAAEARFARVLRPYVGLRLNRVLDERGRIIHPATSVVVRRNPDLLTGDLTFDVASAS